MDDKYYIYGEYLLYVFIIIIIFSYIFLVIFRIIYNSIFYILNPNLLNITLNILNKQILNSLIISILSVYIYQLYIIFNKKSHFSDIFEQNKIYINIGNLFTNLAGMVLYNPFINFVFLFLIYYYVYIIFGNLPSLLFIVVFYVSLLLIEFIFRNLLYLDITIKSNYSSLKEFYDPYINKKIQVDNKGYLIASALIISINTAFFYIIRCFSIFIISILFVVLLIMVVFTILVAIKKLKKEYLIYFYRELYPNLNIFYSLLRFFEYMIIIVIPFLLYYIFYYMNLLEIIKIIIAFIIIEVMLDIITVFNKILKIPFLIKYLELENGIFYANILLLEETKDYLIILDQSNNIIRVYKNKIIEMY
ncbi:hypothetical protein YN1_5520 [Nanoarchaeota archaeon]